MLYPSTSSSVVPFKNQCISGYGKPPAPHFKLNGLLTLTTDSGGDADVIRGGTENSAHVAFGVQKQCLKNLKKLFTEYFQGKCLSGFTGFISCCAEIYTRIRCSNVCDRQSLNTCNVYSMISQCSTLNYDCL